MDITNVNNSCGVRPLLFLAVLLCGLSVGRSADPPTLEDQPRCPRACRVTIDMNPPVAWYNEPYVVTFRYENTGDDMQEVRYPHSPLSTSFKLLVFYKDKQYAGDLLKKRVGAAARGLATCRDWVEIPAGGVFDYQLSLPGRDEMPPSGRYFVQLSLTERFFTECPFRDELCRLRKQTGAGASAKEIEELARSLIENRLRQQRVTLDLRKEAARSNVLEVTFNDRRRQPEAKSSERIEKPPTRSERPNDAGFTAHLSAASELRPDSPADVLVMLERTGGKGAIYNPFFDRRSELPGTLRLLDERGEVVAGDLLGRSETITETPQAGLFGPSVYGRPGARFRLAIDEKGRLSVRTNGVERDAVAQLKPGRYRLVCVYYERTFRHYRPDQCSLREWEREAWITTDPTAVAVGSNTVEMQVIIPTE